ncbi:MAG: mechanosensitive ion channel family protein [Candidatus Saccharimonadales bacterium]
MELLNDFDTKSFYIWMLNTGFDALAAITIGTIVYYTGKKLLARLIKQLVRGTRRNSLHKKDIEKRQKTLVALFATMWRLIVIFSVAYALLRIIFGEAVSSTFAPLFASAGIIGIALGIGAQSLIKDFITGIFIISENQYRVGDVVDIDGFSGTVERIGTRSTVLRDVDGNVHYFPNGMVQHVVNKTMGYSMSRFTIAVHPSTDVDRVTKTIDRIGERLSNEKEWEDKIIEAPSFAAIGEINGNAVELIISGKTQPSDQWAVTAEMRRRLLEQFEKDGTKMAILPVMTQTTPKK